MQSSDTIETERLTLRPPTPRDAEAIFAGYAQDPEVTKYLVWQPHQSIADTIGFLDWCNRERATGTVFPWVIVVRETDRVAGMIQASLDGHQAEVGYVLAHDLWGQGIMTEATRAVIDWALALPAIWRVWAYTDIDNTSSRRVLEKAGMVREGLLHRRAIHPNVGSEPRHAWAYAIWRD